MMLSELLRPDLIKVGLDAETKRHAIGELVDLLVQQHEVPMMERDNVLDEVLAKDAIVSSGMEHGIAIPHTDTDKVDDIICAMGIAPDGITFESLDGQPARIVVLLLVPKKNFAGEVRALAGIEHLFENAALRAEVLAQKDAKSVYDVIDIQEHARRG